MNTIHPADRQPSLALRIAKWAVFLPAVALVGVAHWVRRRFAGPPSESERRSEEKARRRRIKRELRGLEPEPPAASHRARRRRHAA